MLTDTYSPSDQIRMAEWGLELRETAHYSDPVHWRYADLRQVRAWADQ